MYDLRCAAFAVSRMARGDLVQLGCKNGVDGERHGIAVGRLHGTHGPGRVGTPGGAE